MACPPPCGRAPDTPTWGLATIYRQFPTKEVLYHAILVDRLRRLVDQAESLFAAPDRGPRS
jgi:hypothetical protein